MTALVVLLGHGIAYSASPAMHNAAFEALRLDARYELRDVGAAELPAEVGALHAADGMGANVTKPHKVAVCELVDELGPEVRRLGAANTIVRSGDRLVARNTDLPALRAELPPGVRHAVILGAGGASRAAVDALLAAGCEDVVVIDRARWASIPEALMTADLLVNATTIGTDSDETPVPADLLRPEMAVLDLVYRPSPSRLVRDARAAGARARGGASMLLRQAALSFSLWTDREAPIDVMRDALRRELRAGSHA